MAAGALRLFVTLLGRQAGSGPTVVQRALPPAMALLQSPLLQGAAAEALQGFFAALLKSGAPQARHIALFTFPFTLCVWLLASFFAQLRLPRMSISAGCTCISQGIMTLAACDCLRSFMLAAINACVCHCRCCRPRTMPCSRCCSTMHT